MTFLKYITIICWQVESGRSKSDLTAGFRPPDQADRCGFCTPNSVLLPALGGNRYIYIDIALYLYNIYVTIECRSPTKARDSYS